MRLRLVRQTPASDPGEKGWRLLEQGELTLGRADSCGWVLPDSERRISSVHCRINRDALGYKLRDESTNGVTVDNRALAQGETVRLSNGSVIAFCGQRFGVEITGEAEPDWVDPDQNLQLSDDVPSITAILADVAPVGRTATGMLPGRLGDDWMDTDATKSEAKPAEPALSRTPVGWSGPPEAGILADSAALPDDWDTDVLTSSRSEHVVATSTRMRTPAAAKPAETVEPQGSVQSADDALDAFLRGLGETGAVIEDPLIYLRRMGVELQSLRTALRDMDREMRELTDEFGEAPAMPAAADLNARLADARRQRERLVDAVRELVRDTDRLEPDAIERRAAIEDGRPASLIERVNPASARLRRAWTRFRETYRGTASDGSPRARFVARLTGTSTPLDDEFEELSADRPRDGGKVA
jgi:type VI secretion system protein ImpI